MSQYNLFLQIDHGKGGTSFHSVIPPLERVWPHSLTPFLKVFVNTEGCKLLQAKQVPQPFLIRREALQSPHHLCSPALDSLQYFHCLCWTGKPRSEQDTWDVASPCHSRGGGSTPWTTGHTPPCAPRITCCVFSFPAKSSSASLHLPLTSNVIQEHFL